MITLISASVIVLIALAVRVGRFDYSRFKGHPIAWVWCLGGHIVLGVGTLATIMAAHLDTQGAYRFAISLILAGIAMVFTRNRRPRQ